MAAEATQVPPLGTHDKKQNKTKTLSPFNFDLLDVLGFALDFEKSSRICLLLEGKFWVWKMHVKQ